MQTYAIPLVPGPVSIPPEVRTAYGTDYGSADLEDEFFALYTECERKLQTILGANCQIAIQSGEGMIALWGALKSVLRPGDRVLTVSTGLFGKGISDMARGLGAEVEIVDFGLDGVADAGRVRDAARRFRPKLLTAVHCETPSGTLNSLHELGSICREVDALFYVDFVASGVGVPVNVDASHIDLGLLGSQKVLSLMPDLSMVTISAHAWDAIAATAYSGYDALAPWQTAVSERYFPYTHNWHAMAGLKVGLDLLCAEGIEQVYARHADVAAFCRRRCREIGLTLFPTSDDICSPTVTAIHVPDGRPWSDFDAALRSRGMVVGGNYGPLAGKVFRIGHMGNQARMELVAQGMETIDAVLKSG